MGCQALAGEFEFKRLGKVHGDHSPRPLLITMPTAEAARKILTAPKPTDRDFMGIRFKRDYASCISEGMGTFVSVRISGKKQTGKQRSYGVV